MTGLLTQSITPMLRSSRAFTRKVSSKPDIAQRSPASKSASAGPQATNPSTGFAAIASYDVIARRWLGIMVGTPVIVVTSYILYQRGKANAQDSFPYHPVTSTVVNGEEQRPFDKLLKAYDFTTDRSEDG